MSEFAAIPSIYKGVSMRSRFEANAAYLLDAIGVTWQYEPLSFLLDDGTHYRPDFYVPELNLWLECRGVRAEIGERQIRGFGDWIRNGRLEPDGTVREPSVWDWDSLQFSNGYYPDAPDYLVLRGDAEPTEWWEYICRESSTSHPVATSVDLMQCGTCTGWFFGRSWHFHECRRCGRVDAWNRLAYSALLDVDAGAITLQEKPLRLSPPEHVAEWARRKGLLGTGAGKPL